MRGGVGFGRQPPSCAADPRGCLCSLRTNPQGTCTTARPDLVDRSGIPLTGGVTCVLPTPVIESLGFSPPLSRCPIAASHGGQGREIDGACLAADSMAGGGVKCYSPLLVRSRCSKRSTTQWRPPRGGSGHTSTGLWPRNFSSS